MLVRNFTKLHDEQTGNATDEKRWQEVQEIRVSLLKDDTGRSSVFSKIHEAIALRDFLAVSTLQRQMDQAIDELKHKYHEYQLGLLD